MQVELIKTFPENIMKTLKTCGLKGLRYGKTIMVRTYSCPFCVKAKMTLLGMALKYFKMVTTIKKTTNII